MYYCTVFRVVVIWHRLNKIELKIPIYLQILADTSDLPTYRLVKMNYSISNKQYISLVFSFLIFSYDFF